MSKKYDVELITDKNGKPMPQYYDAEENLMKPITSDNKDFPNEIDVSNLPSDYPDTAVKAELESIKQTQSEILERLDGEFNTRLSGSIAEYMWLHSDVEPTPKESRAIGVRIEEDNSMTTLYWNGSSWNEVA